MAGPAVQRPSEDGEARRTAASPRARPRSEVRRARLVWGIQIAVAVICGTAGALKLAGHPTMVEIFARIGAGQWLLGATGVVEIAGALMLLRAPTAAAGALVLAGVMGGAIAVQLDVLHEFPFTALAVLAMLIVIVAARGEPLERLLSRARTRGTASPS